MAAFALHLSHPDTGLRIEECVYGNHLALRANGHCFRGRIGGRGGNSEEVLNFDWWYPQHGFNFAVIGVTRWVGGQQQRGEGEPVILNGEPLQNGKLKVGDRLEWRDTIVLVKEALNPGPLVREQAERGRANDTTLEVFADWLEANGAAGAAEYTRGVIHQADRERLEVLARQLPLSLRAMIARGPIERCDRQCAQRWEALPIGPKETWLKRCGECQQHVSWCDNPQYMAPRGPVVFCPSALRRDGDLYPVHVVG
jgi:hypothetical protein